MVLNDAGEMVEKNWSEIPMYYQGFLLHGFVVMPNHIHGVIELVGTTPPCLSVPDIIMDSFRYGYKYDFLLKGIDVFICQHGQLQGDCPYGFVCHIYLHIEHGQARGRCPYATSNNKAAPCPPPIQSVDKPRCNPRFLSS